MVKAENCGPRASILKVREKGCDAVPFIFKITILPIKEEAVKNMTVIFHSLSELILFSLTRLEGPPRGRSLQQGR